MILLMYMEEFPKHSTIQMRGLSLPSKNQGTSICWSEKVSSHCLLLGKTLEVMAGN